MNQKNIEHKKWKFWLKKKILKHEKKKNEKVINRKWKKKIFFEEKIYKNENFGQKKIRLIA